jgi:hypothetical protein
MAIEWYPKRLYVSLSDGCGWGNAPRAAAVKATKTVVQFLKGNKKQWVFFLWHVIRE